MLLARKSHPSLNKDENKIFYRKMFTIALPITVQFFLSNILSMIDIVMIGSMGENAIAAVGLGNRWSVIYTMVIFGGLSGSTIFSAQYFGAKNLLGVRKVLGISLSFSLIVSLLFSLACLLAPEMIVGCFISDKTVIALGAEYLPFVGVSYLVQGISLTFNFSSRAVHLTKYPMITSVVALSLNTVLNYLLIYGKFGFPALGVQGAAIATLISRVLELILLLALIYRPSGMHPLAGKIRELFSFDFALVKKVTHTALPVLINESLWGLGTTVYFIAFGFMGASTVAAIQIAYTVVDIFQSIFFGMCNACAVLLGNELGSKNYERAVIYSNKFIKIFLIVSALIGAFVFFAKPILLHLYDLKPDTQVVLMQLVTVVAVFTIPRMYSYLMIVGILRSGGDTRFCLIVEVFGVWGLGVPLAFLGTLALHAPAFVVLSLVYLEEIIKSIICYYRYKKETWVKNLIYE